MGSGAVRERFDRPTRHNSKLSPFHTASIFRFSKRTPMSLSVLNLLHKLFVGMLPQQRFWTSCFLVCDIATTFSSPPSHNFISRPCKIYRTVDRRAMSTEQHIPDHRPADSKYHTTRSLTCFVTDALQIELDPGATEDYMKNVRYQPDLPNTPPPVEEVRD